MDKIYLFTYGTLSDPEYTQLLLNRLPVYTEACLPGYNLLIHPGNGYLFVTKDPDQQVPGQLLEVTPAELKLTDLWEDVPLYQRELLPVTKKSGQQIKAFVYTQNETWGLPFQYQHLKKRREILQEIEEFLESVRKSGMGR